MRQRQSGGALLVGRCTELASGRQRSLQHASSQGMHAGAENLSISYIQCTSHRGIAGAAAGARHLPLLTRMEMDLQLASALCLRLCPP
jgi:hypothetical protein